jgi:hypothetical protein
MGAHLGVHGGVTLIRRAVILAFCENFCEVLCCGVGGFCARRHQACSAEQQQPCGASCCAALAFLALREKSRFLLDALLSLRNLLLIFFF